MRVQYRIPCFLARQDLLHFGPAAKRFLDDHQAIRVSYRGRGAPGFHRSPPATIDELHLAEGTLSRTIRKTEADTNEIGHIKTSRSLPAGGVPQMLQNMPSLGSEQNPRVRFVLLLFTWCQMWLLSLWLCDNILR